MLGEYKIHLLPAKLLDTSSTFFCHDPKSTPTTRFWFPTLPILKEKAEGQLRRYANN